MTVTRVYKQCLSRYLQHPSHSFPCHCDSRYPLKAQSPKYFMSMWLKVSTAHSSEYFQSSNSRYSLKTHYRTLFTVLHTVTQCNYNTLLTGFHITVTQGIHSTLLCVSYAQCLRYLLKAHFSEYIYSTLLTVFHTVTQCNYSTILSLSCHCDSRYPHFSEYIYIRYIYTSHCISYCDLMYPQHTFHSLSGHCDSRCPQYISHRT